MTAAAAPDRDQPDAVDDEQDGHHDEQRQSMRAIHWSASFRFMVRQR
jgi:hypothetical protein